MKKKLLFLVILILIIPVSFSLEVDKGELESIENNDSIVFENYNGPYLIINTIAQINNIGIELGNVISTDILRAQNTGNLARYQIIHAVDPTTTVGLDADILIIGKDALVDHIDNLRRIIASYLQVAYNYTPENAKTLAVFITVYNAVYREQINVFAEKYKPIVTQNLIGQKVGLALNYAEWPDNTQIVIPLADLNGGLGTIDTGVISDTNVVESLREEPDMGIEERKDLVDIKENESKIATENAQDAQKNAVIAKQDVIEKTKDLEILEEKAEIAVQNAEDNPDDPIAQENAEIAQTEVTQQKEDIVQAEENLTILEQEAETQQTIADNRQEDAQSDRIEIAQDQEDILRNTTSEDQFMSETMGFDQTVNLAYGLKMTNALEQLSTLVLIDTLTGRTVKESDIDVIRNRMIFADGDSYIAIAGTQQLSGNSAVRLVKLDSTNMNIIVQSNELIALNSTIVKEGEFYYVTIEDGSTYYTAKYNNNIELILKSAMAVLPETPIIVTKFGIMVTDAKGFAKLLRIEDLVAIQ